MSIDRKRLAEAARRLRKDPPWPAFGLTGDAAQDARNAYNAALDHLQDEYDRLTAEWQERMRSINLSPSATPTRSKK